jgi:flagellar biosynthesis protein FlhA
MTALALRLRSLDYRTALLPAGILAIVALMVVPVPAWALDLFFVFNILAALVVLMIALGIEKPLDFSSFPTVLLLTTLLRLSLNVASTRVVLMHGHEGTAAAGQVIEAFGSFVIGGDYLVGLFVFLIIVIINLVVITKGAGRVSEVSARFTLDALPGKQMAIDADLGAGLLTADEAKARRAEVAVEADFYGSMDGASKFVKGDAVAGILILLVNMFGGLIVGVVQHDLPFGEAARLYFVLTVGDGLVAQIPALLLSIAAAAVVTRVTSPLDLSGQLSSQFAKADAWTAAAVILGLIGILPGMPHLLLLGAAAGSGALAWQLRRMPVEPTGEARAEPLRSGDIGWGEVSDAAPITLDIGYGLIGLVDPRKGAPLMARITAMRRQLSAELGFVLPLVRVKDDIGLPPANYRIRVGGAVAGEDAAYAEDCLALAAGPVDGPLDGLKVKEPSFGIDATWIPPEARDAAEAAGYTVVDAATVVATHLSQILARRAHDLLGQDEAQKLLDTLARAAPHLAANLSPKPLPLGTVTQVLRNLLDERVPIRDFRRVGEALAVAAMRSADPEELTELVRPALGELIVERVAGFGTPLKCVTLDPALEQLLIQHVRADPGGAIPLDPGLARRILDALAALETGLARDGTRLAEGAAMVVSPPVRRLLRNLTRPVLPELAVLSFRELPGDKPVEVIAAIGEREGE